MPTHRGDMISRWYPEKTKIEIFARKDNNVNLWGKNTFDGWDVWGNEVESDIDLIN